VIISQGCHENDGRKWGWTTPPSEPENFYT